MGFKNLTLRETFRRCLFKKLSFTGISSFEIEICPTTNERRSKFCCFKVVSKFFFRHRMAEKWTLQFVLLFYVMNQTMIIANTKSEKVKVKLYKLAR